MGLRGVSRSCRDQPCARSTATDAPVWVADIMVPYIAIETMMYAATDTPPDASGVSVSGTSRVWNPTMKNISTGNATVNRMLRGLRSLRTSSMRR